jgi:hypothetical protein
VILCFIWILLLVLSFPWEGLHGNPRGYVEIERLGSRTCASSACAGDSLFPQSGQVSKPAEATPNSTVVSFRSTVTSVRTVRLAWFVADVSERKAVARCLNH